MVIARNYRHAASNYAREAGVLKAELGFIFGMGGGFYNLKEIFMNKPAVWPASARRRSWGLHAKGRPRAAAHYMHMHRTWCKCIGSPMSTGMWIGPNSSLRMIKVNLILKAAQKPVSAGVF